MWKTDAASNQKQFKLLLLKMTLQATELQGVITFSHTAYVFWLGF